MFYFLFWLSAILLIIGTIGYPTILWLLTKFKSKAIKDYSTLPGISIVLPCYNEENYIGRKLNNLLQLDYPSEKLEIIVVSDGSDDHTEVIVEIFQPQPQLKLISLPERRGKPQALNAGVAAATGDIIVFSDSRQTFNPTCLRELVSHFKDEKVGGVTGTLLDYKSQNPTEKIKVTQKFSLVALFRSYENIIKKWESSLHSVVGVYGALYAIRRKLYKPLPTDIILDDMLVPFNVIQQGFRVVFEPLAIAYESSKKNLEIEIARRRRTIIGNFQLLLEYKELVSIKKNVIWWQFFCHKIIRLLFPALFFLVFLSNLFVANHPFYNATLLGQLLFYGLCLLSLVFKKPALLYFFSKLNLTVFQAGYDYFRKSQSVIWPKQS